MYMVVVWLFCSGKGNAESIWVDVSLECSLCMLGRGANESQPLLRWQHSSAGGALGVRLRLRSSVMSLLVHACLCQS